jgi:hypothetical protein
VASWAKTGVAAAAASEARNRRRLRVMDSCHKG